MRIYVYLCVCVYVCVCGVADARLQIRVESDEEGKVSALIDVELVKSLSAQKLLRANMSVAEDDTEAVTLAAVSAHARDREDLARRTLQLQQLFLWEHRAPMRYTMAVKAVADVGVGWGGCNPCVPLLLLFVVLLFVVLLVVRLRIDLPSFAPCSTVLGVQLLVTTPRQGAVDGRRVAARH